MAVIRKSTNTLLTGLSDFWQRLFKDTHVLNALYEATEVQLGQAYLDIMSNVLNANLRQAPLFDRELWKLVTMRADLVRMNQVTGLWEWEVDDGVVDFQFLQNRIYDPTVVLERDVDFTVEGEGLVTFTADPFSPAYDGVPTRQVEVTPTKYRSGNDGIVTTSTPSTFDVVGRVKSGRDGETLTSTRFSSATADFTADDVGRELRVYRTGSSPEDDTVDIVAVLTSDLVELSSSFTTVSVPGTGYFWEVRDKVVFTADDVGNDLVLTNPFDTGESQTVEILTVPGDRQVTVDADVDFGADSKNVLWTLQSKDKVLQYAFWAPDALIDNETLYNQFGYLVETYEPSSESYRALLEGVFRYYVEGPSLERIEAALNVVSGVPVARHDGEVVVELDESDDDHDYVVTNFRTYEMPKGSIKDELAVDDELQAFQSLSKVYRVEDHTSDPTWWWGEVVPEELMPQAEATRRNIDPKLYELKWGDTRWQFGDPGLYFSGDGDGNLIPLREGLDGLPADGVDFTKFAAFDAKFFSHDVGKTIYVGTGDYGSQPSYKIIAVGPASGGDYAFAQLDEDISTTFSSSDFVKACSVDEAAQVLNVPSGEFTQDDVGRLVRATGTGALSGNNYYVAKVYSPTIISIVLATTGASPSLEDASPGPESITEITLGVPWRLERRSGLKHTSGYTFMRNFLKQHIFSVEYDLSEYPGVEYVRADADLRDIILQGKPAYVTLFFNPNNQITDEMVASDSLTVIVV